MKYTILINLQGIKRYGFLDKTDAIDWILVDYFYSVIKNESMFKIEREGKVFTWVNYNHLIDEMPILGFKSKGALSKRIRKLEDLGLLEKVLQNNRFYFRLTDIAVAVLTYDDRKDSVRQDEQNVSQSEQSVSQSEQSVYQSERNVYQSERNVSPGKQNVSQSKQDVSQSEQSVSQSERSVSLGKQGVSQSKRGCFPEETKQTIIDKTIIDKTIIDKDINNNFILSESDDFSSDVRLGEQGVNDFDFIKSLKEFYYDGVVRYLSEYRFGIEPWTIIAHPLKENYRTTTQGLIRDVITPNRFNKSLTDAEEYIAKLVNKALNHGQLTVEQFSRAYTKWVSSDKTSIRAFVRFLLGELEPNTNPVNFTNGSTGKNYNPEQEKQEKKDPVKEYMPEEDPEIVALKSELSGLYIQKIKYSLSGRKEVPKELEDKIKELEKKLKELENAKSKSIQT